MAAAICLYQAATFMVMLLAMHLHSFLHMKKAQREGLPSSWCLDHRQHLGLYSSNKVYPGDNPFLIFFFFTLAVSTEFLFNERLLRSPDGLT